MNRLGKAITVIIAGALLLAPSIAGAWPNGPGEDPRLDPPNDPGFNGQWNLWSYFPDEWLANIADPTEKTLGSGIHADRAWQVTTGDRRVIIAVLDSGAYWDNKDLVNKFYLNRGELAACKPDPMDTPPPGADEFDVDGSGWFDIRDYYAKVGAEADALAAWDTNGNGMLDPQDLIQKCSDGVDDDGDGYVDNISGWDFFQDDNDAYDDTRFGHGNGEARDSTAEGNNGMGDIGVCPSCTALMVRVGDSFVADANDFAQGVIFGVDSGASVIQEALGSLNNTPLSQRAIDYAYDNNVAIIASAADELSYHHNFPGTNNHTIYVHAVVYDAASTSAATTFLNFNTCTNFGMQLLLSTPGGGCSSEATGITSGHAGLMYAAALQANGGAGLDPPITAEEIKQVMVSESDDIAINPDGSDLGKFPSAEGWDFHFGYGRNNARRTVDAIMEGRIPPEVDIVDPAWFEVIYPDRTPSVDVTGRINVRRDGLDPRFTSVDWVLEYGVGVVPRGDDWVEIASGTTDGMEGVIAAWDVTSVPLDLDAKVTDAHQNAVTVRLRATGTLPGGESITGEHRKGFIFEKDQTVREGFPIRLGTSGESSPTFANLDGDDDEELVVALADGTVHAFQQDGSELAGWPVEMDRRRAMDTDNPTNVASSCAFRDDKTGCLRQQGKVDAELGRQTMVLAPAVGDIDGDGDLEIVVSTWDGWVFIWEHDGTRREGWPKSVDWALSALQDKKHIVDGGFLASPVLYDLDGQPGLEVVAAAMDGYLYVWHEDGSPMAPYPVFVGSQDPADGAERLVATPAIGDIDGDGLPEIALGTSEVFGAGDAQNEALAYVLDGTTGQVEDGWPQSLFGLMVNVLPIVGRGVPTNAILADLDYDGQLEISFDTIATQGWIFRADGSIYRKMNNRDFGASSDSADSPSYVLMNNGAFGFIDPEGGLDFVKGTAGFDFALAFAGGGKLPDERQPNGNVFDHQLSGWDTDTGEALVGFPRVIDDWQFFNTPTIVDLNNDTDPEVVIASAGYLVHAWNYKGEEPAGWPKQTGGWIIASVAVGEFDGDGLFEVAVTTRDGFLFVWDTEGEVGSIFEWNGYGHDPHNTNNYETDPTPYKVWEAKKPPTPDATPDEDSDIGNDVDADAGTGDVEADTGSETTGGSKDDDGCASTPGGHGPLAGLLLVLLAMAVFGRRRRVRE